VFGAELKRLREKSGLSQEQLAAQAGVHRTYVSLLERGKKSPTLDVLFRICRALDIAPSKVIARIESQHENR